MKGLWKGYFEWFMNNRAEGEAVTTSMSIEADRGRVLMYREIGRLEVERAIPRLKCRKVAGIDGITEEMLSMGGDAVVEWMLLICERTWKKGEVPVDWKRAIIVPLYKGKYRGISLLSVPGKMRERILTERLIEVTEGKLSEKWGGFRKGRGCVDQIFAMKMLVEEYFEKDRKLYAAFMDLEKAYDRVDREALGSVLKIYGVGRQLLKGMG